MFAIIALLMWPALSQWASALPDSCEDRLEFTASFASEVGTHEDSFVHVSIEDELWARTILPKRSSDEGWLSTERREPLRITWGNTEFPNMIFLGEYVTYFDQHDGHSISGSRESRSVQLHLKSGITFEMRFSYDGFRRAFQLWAHGLSGGTSSKLILTGSSGIEMFL